MTWIEKLISEKPGCAIVAFIVALAVFAAFYAYK